MTLFDSLKRGAVNAIDNYVHPQPSDATTDKAQETGEHNLLPATLEAAKTVVTKNALSNGALSGLSLAGLAGIEKPAQRVAAQSEVLGAAGQRIAKDVDRLTIIAGVLAGGILLYLFTKG